MKHKTPVLCLLGLLLLATLAWSSTRASSVPPVLAVDPTVPPIPAAPPSPSDGDTVLVPTPSDGRTVMDLDLMVSSAAPDALSVVTQRSCVVIQDWSNKSLYSGAGQWDVQLQVPSGDPVAYGVRDPRFQELAPTAAQPPQEVFLPSAEWVLDVPLFDGANNLQVKEVDIFDQRGQEVFAVGIGQDGSCQPVSLPNARDGSPAA